MKVNVFVTPEFIFQGGEVKGKILVDPDSLINAIYDNSTFSFRDPRIVNVKKEIAKRKNKSLESGEPEPVICLQTGIVTKNFMQMDLLDAADMLFDYLEYPDSDSSESCRELYEFLQKCRDIEYPSQMSNVI